MLNNTWMQTAAGLAAVLFMLTAGADAQAQQRRIIRVAPRAKVQSAIVIRTTDDVDQEKRIAVKVVPEGRVVVKEVARSEYWIGVGCVPAPPALRAQLGLDEGTGLVVQHVIPESSAATVGIRQHDVLLRAGEQTLKEIADLVHAVADAKDKALEIELVRGGEKRSVALTPRKRSERNVHVRVLEPDMRRTWKWFERLQPGQAPQFNFRFRRPGEAFALEFPDDLNIRVEKKGDDSAKITVEKGDDKWEVAEDALDELPEDVRRFVDSVLGRTPAMRYELVQPQFKFYQRTEKEREREDEAEGDFGRSLEGLLERLEKRLNEQMEKLQQRLEELQKRIPAEAAEGVNSA